MIAPDWLFDRAGISDSTSVAWNEKVSERGPGVYIISSSHQSVGQSVVYIGRSKHLRRRLNEFYRHKYGSRAPHRGGQEVLRLPGNLTVHWAAVADYPAAEKAMLEAFREAVGVWPIANLVKAAAVTSALLD